MIPAALWADDKPLSAIDWLDKPTPFVTPKVTPEPPVTPVVQQPIEVQPLTEAPRLIGLVPSTTTGLPNSLWEESNTETLVRLIAETPVLRSPPMQRLFFTLLLAEARAPVDDRQERLLAARAARLLDLGAADPALALLDVSGPLRRRDVFALWFDAALLTGEETRACAAVANAPRFAPGQAARIYCAVLSGDWNTAALLLESAHALNTLPKARLDLFDRFLSPEVFDGAPPLPPPDKPDVLDVRMFEAIGERLPTASLPRVFAWIDLADIAGWKAQVEAAERLARSGALEPNRLLGLYTERRAAASGGVWDRVRTVQQFETALAQPTPTALEATLPVVWAQMQRAGLSTTFAGLFADRLSERRLEQPEARELAWKISLLSPNYEAAASRAPENTAAMRYLSALAIGRPEDARAPNAKAQAVANGFTRVDPLPIALRDARDNGRLGEYILLSISLFDRGVQGDLNALETGLAALRAVGLEDISRRAALHYLLVGKDSL
jgi:hypothetical protein